MNLDNQVISWSRTYNMDSAVFMTYLFIYIYILCVYSITIYAISYIQVLVSSALLPQLCYPDGFLSPMIPFFPSGFWIIGVFP